MSDKHFKSLGVATMSIRRRNLIAVIALVFTALVLFYSGPVFQAVNTVSWTLLPRFAGCV